MTYASLTRWRSVAQQNGVTTEEGRLFSAYVRDRAIIVQQKTKRPVQFELMDTARKTMRTRLERRGGTLNDYVFPSRNDYMAHMSTRQFARLVHEWVAGIGLQSQEYGTHPLRRTKASIIYKATGNLRAVQTLLSQSKIESTLRYLGGDEGGRSGTCRADRGLSWVDDPEADIQFGRNFARVGRAALFDRPPEPDIHSAVAPRLELAEIGIATSWRVAA